MPHDDTSRRQALMASATPAGPAFRGNHGPTVVVQTPYADVSAPPLVSRPSRPSSPPLMRLVPLLLLALPLGLSSGGLAAQRPVPPPKDTLTAAERAAVRETVRDAAQAARRNLAGDSVTRRRRADSAS